MPPITTKRRYVRLRLLAGRREPRLPCLELRNPHVRVRKAGDQLELSPERADVAGQLAEQQVLALLQLGDRPLGDLQQLG